MKFFIILIISCIYLIDSVNSKSKYYDGPDRAYKFGYSIEGNQHRQETKDENGIIMGEFGFITADGVYHVTGYGTDENGNFKILYMKNIKIGLPGEPGQEPAPKNIGGSIPQQSPRVSPTNAPAPVQKQPATEIKKPKASDTPSCGSCIIPEIEKEVNQAVKQTLSSGANAIAQAPRTPSGGNSGSSLASLGGVAPGFGASRTAGGGVPSASTSGGGPGISGLSEVSAQKLPTQSLAGGAAGNRAAAGAQGRQGKALGLGLGFPASSDPISLSDSNAQEPNIDIRTLSSQNGETPSSQSSLSNAGVPPRPGALLPSGASQSPSGVSQSSGSSPGSRGGNNNQNTFGSDPSGLTIASGSPSGSSSSQGGNSGSPPRIPLDLSQMQNIINGILYKFNYTVGYHGHHEEGDHIGNKDGGYYSIGRDGLHRSVDYTANENGFQPHIKLRPVNDPNEIPKPETEKEAGLKGYEFKWFNLGEGNHNDKRQ